MRSQRDMRSMLSKAALKSTNAMYNVRLCSLQFSIICRRAKIRSMVECPGMKPACCIRLRDLIAETDLRRRMSARSFPGIDTSVVCAVRGLCLTVHCSALSICLGSHNC